MSFGYTRNSSLIGKKLNNEKTGVFDNIQGQLNPPVQIDLKNWAGTFTTSSTYLQVPHTSTLNIERVNYCMECWINHNFNGGTTLGGLITKRPGSDSSFWFSITGSTSTTMKIYYAAWRGGADSVVGATNLVLGTWYHVAVTRTTTSPGSSTVPGTIRLFVNGMLDAVMTELRPAYQNTNALKIGRTDASSTSRYYRGKMSNVRITRDGFPPGYETSSTTVGEQIFTPQPYGWTPVSGDGSILVTLQSSTHINTTSSGLTVQQVGSVPLAIDPTLFA